MHWQVAILLVNSPNISSTLPCFANTYLYAKSPLHLLMTRDEKGAFRGTTLFHNKYALILNIGYCIHISFTKLYVFLF